MEEYHMITFFRQPFIMKQRKAVHFFYIQSLFKFSCLK